MPYEPYHIVTLDVPCRGPRTEVSNRHIVTETNIKARRSNEGGEQDVLAVLRKRGWHAEDPKRLVCPKCSKHDAARIKAGKHPGFKK